MKRTPMQRWAAKVQLPTEWKEEACWEWVGGKTGAGYGSLWANGRHILAHRFAYESFVGPIPEGLHLDHLCRNRGCVNPDHLEAVTCRENLLRGVGLTARHAKTTHCPKGHEYAGANLYVYPHGGRECRTCKRDSRKTPEGRAYNRAYLRARYARKKLEATC